MRPFRMHLHGTSNRNFRRVRTHAHATLALVLLLSLLLPLFPLGVAHAQTSQVRQERRLNREINPSTFTLVVASHRVSTTSTRLPTQPTITSHAPHHTGPSLAPIDRRLVRTQARFPVPR